MPQQPRASSPASRGALRVGFVEGVTTDRWARAWAERMPRRRLELVPVSEQQDPVSLLRAGELRMCFLRLPDHAERDTEGLHVIVLYDEQPVVVVAKEHPVAAYDEIDLADLADEHLIRGPDPTVRVAVERVAADAGIVILPVAVARRHRRRDVTHVPVRGVPSTSVALVWLRDPRTEPDPAVDPEVDREDVGTFIGVVRGRTANSSRR